MLKKYFAKFDKRAVRNIHIFVPIMVLAFIFAGFAFFEALRMICNILGAIVCKSPWQALDHLERCGSSIILFAGSIYFATYIYRLFFASEERQSKIQKKGAITLIVFGGIGLIYFIVGFATGLYKIYEGYPTLIYPIDMVILAAAFVGLGVFFFLDKKYVNEFSIAGLVVNPELSKPVKVLRVAGFVFEYLVACFSIYGVIMCGFIFDWRVYPLWGIVFFLIMVEVLLTFGYQFLVAPFLQNEVRRKVSFQLSYLAFFIGLVLVVLNTISVFFYNNIACEVANGLLVISFTASFNVEYYLFTIALLVPPVMMFNKNFPKKS